MPSPPASVDPEAAPPETVEALARLLAAVRSGDGPVRLGRRAIRALAMLVDAPGRTAVFSITDLARDAGVNASTITRLAKRLGYQGFGELQAVFRRDLALAGHFYSDRAERIVDEAQGTGRALFERIAGDEVRNVRSMLEAIDPQVLEKVVELLAGAHRVRVHGLRQMFSIATFLSYALGMLRDDVAVLGVPGHGVAHALAQLSADDVLVVVGCAPYTRTTVEVCRLASASGYPVVAITDSLASPLSIYASHTFVAPTDSAFFSSSLAAMVVFGECLMSAVASRLGARAVRALKHRESFLRELSVEY